MVGSYCFFRTSFYLGTNENSQMLTITLSIKQWAEIVNISPVTISSRLRRGLTPEQAIKHTHLERCNHFIVIDGIKALPSTHARRIGITVQGLFARIKNGVPAEDLGKSSHKPWQFAKRRKTLTNSVEISHI